MRPTRGSCLLRLCPRLATAAAVAAALLAGGAAAWAEPQGAAAPAASATAGPVQPPPPPSLMFSADEINRVKAAIAYRERLIAEGGGSAIEGQADTAEAVAARHPNIYVSAILDLGGGRWTVWANGMRITPETQSPLFSVIGVRDDAVDIFVPGDDGGKFRLHPYETWRARQRDVVPGIVP